MAENGDSSFLERPETIIGLNRYAVVKSLIMEGSEF